MLTHTDATGVTTPIAVLDDTHLKNIIKWYFGKIERAMKVLDCKDEDLPSSKNSGAVLYCGQRINHETMRKEAEEQLTFAHDQLPPYIFEATIRDLKGLDEWSLTTSLQRLLGRKEQVQEEDILPINSRRSIENHHDF